jgi:L-ascorbate metabolism protein UlaG (beta-lactamase superfamily)
MKLFGFLTALFIFGSVYQISAQETKIKWFGHAAFSITTPKGKVLLIDPWLNNPLNPEAKDGKDPLAAVQKLTIFSSRTDTATTSAMRWKSPKRPARF